MELYWYASGQRRKALETGSEVGRGQEGAVFEVLSEPGTVVKVFKADPGVDEAKLKERAAKLKLFVKHPPYNPPDPSGDGHRKFAWPERVLFNGAGQCAGYAMPRVPCGGSLDTFIYPKDGVLPERELRVALACEVASIMDEVHHHALSMVIGDVSAANFLADAKGRVSVIDIDSAEITSPDDGHVYLCPTRTSEYTAPELIGRNLSTMHRAKEHDLFSLAVLIYQLLADGWHPFAVRHGRSVELRIVAGDCPQITGGAGRPPEAPPFGGGPDFDVGDELRALFVRAFVDGHREPRMRPRAAEWNRPLLCYEKRLGRLVASVPGPAPRVTPSAPPWRHRRTVVAFGGAAAIAASVGFFYVGRPIGDADVKWRVSAASAVDSPDLEASVVEPGHEIVTNDGAGLLSGPERIGETPLYWRLVRDGRYESLSFGAALDGSLERERESE